jgi:hypothetical protein
MISRMSDNVTLMRETLIDKGCSVLKYSIQTIGGIVIALINKWMVALLTVA